MDRVTVPENPPRAQRRRLWGLALLLTGLLLLGTGSWALRAVRARIEAKAHHLLRDSDFQLSWAHIDVGLGGTIALREVVLRTVDAPPILSIGSVEIRLDLLALLRGHKRARAILLREPQVVVALDGGKPQTWLHLREVLRRNREASEDDEGQAGQGLARRVDRVQIAEGSLRVRTIGAGPLAAREFVLNHLAADVDLDQPLAAVTAAFAGLAGKGSLAVDVHLAGRRVTAAELRATPPLTVPALPLPAQLTGISVRIGGAAWSQDGPELREVVVQGPKGLAATIRRGLWQRGEAEQVVQALGVHATAYGAWVDIESLRLQAPSLRDLAKPAAWQSVAIEGPHLSLPISAPPLLAQPALRAHLLEIAAMRQPVAAPAAEDDAADDDDEAEVPETPPPPPPAHQRPAIGWMADLRHGHARLLTLYAALEKAWPMAKVPPSLALTVHGAQVDLLGDGGQPLLGLHGASLYLGSDTPDGRPLHLGGSLRDAVGTWGSIGLEWRRDPRTAAHRLDIHVSGAGVAQLLASRVRGMGIGAGADLDVYATMRLPDARSLEVEGRVDIDHMGIDWWRLADRPIADFRLALPFALSVRSAPDSLSLRAPDIDLGGAHLEAEVDIAHIDGNPRVRLWLEAPMQDCGTMLHAVPPSLLPTVGRIDAHGTLGWHAGVMATLPMVGAVHVDLALADTPCTVDKLGAIDLGEFLRKDWSRPVNENGTLLDDVPIGPGSGSWTPLTGIPGYVTYAMWATEDSFLRHRGLSESLIEKALGIDLTTGHFTYGGSTITQQLVKNLFLKRTKALSRKFEEMLIVWQMERQLGKQRILEIYVNAVEFGPKVYGVTRAAWSFFSKKPAELLPKEGVYLAIIKPSPRSGYGTMRVNGWGDWYEEKTTKYMDKLLRDNSISQAQYDADVPFKPAFNPPGH